MEVLKVTRCSAAGPIMADHLSKAKFREFRAEADRNDWTLQTAPAAIPRALLRWLDRPGPYDGLGTEILKEIGGQVPLAGYSADYEWWR
jgi:hypothetical protein